MIQLSQITKIFNRGLPNEVVALDQVDLEISKGEFAIIVGANGSGKTTLLNTLGGAELPTEGKVFLQKADITRLDEYRRSRWIARVFQNPSQGSAPDLSILENFRMAALRSHPKKLRIGLTSNFAEIIRGEVAALGMGLENKLTQPMGSLSGGQRQALTLLMAVSDQCEILLLDEPTAALDPRSSRIVLELAQKINREKKITTLLITHNLKDAQQYGNRLIVMQSGRIVHDWMAKEKSALTANQMFELFG